jgi:PrtD family type I secretion system ABC transporter
MALGVLVLFSLGMNLLVLASPLYMLQVYDRVLVTGRLETLALLTVLAATALLVYGLLDALRSISLVRVSCWLVDRLGPVYLDSTVRARLRGDTAGAQPLRDLDQIQAFIASPGLVVFLDLPWVPLSLVLIWLLHPALGVLALVSLLALLALGALNEALTRQPTLDASHSQIAAAHLADAMAGNAEAVWAMGMLRAMTERWRHKNADRLNASRRGYETGALILGTTKFVRLFVQSAMLGLGAYLFTAGELTGGAMIASSILLGRALQPIEIAVSSWRGWGAARAAWSRLQMRAQFVPPEPVRTRLPEPAGRVTFDRVTYIPPGGSAPVLRDVSFQALPGEALAIVGHSASGKSTLCRLIVGTAEPSAGEVRIDGSEIRHWNPEDLGRHIGYLPQDVELFAGTVRENIARMTDDEEDEAVVEAARLAQAQECIRRLPQGYDTPVGDGGARLSGGQRQRIGLARAVYRCPRLIVLDEPNANLDEQGEAALAAAIDKLKRRGCTVLIVGHRPSTLAQADKVLLLAKGRVLFFGTHDEVLRHLRQA